MAALKSFGPARTEKEHSSIKHFGLSQPRQSSRLWRNPTVTICGHLYYGTIIGPAADSRLIQFWCSRIRIALGPLSSQIVQSKSSPGVSRAADRPFQNRSVVSRDGKWGCKWRMVCILIQHIFVFWPYFG